MALLRFSKPDATEAAPEQVGLAKREYDSNEGVIVRKGTRATELAEQVQQFVQEEQAARVLADEPARIQNQVATEEARIAACELDGIEADTTHLVDLRRQLSLALARKDDAESRARIASLKAAKRREDLAALQDDIRIHIGNRPALVTKVLAERLATVAPEFEELRKIIITKYASVFAIARAHDLLAEALRTGQFVGGLKALDLRLPIPDGFQEVLDLQKLYTEIDAAAIALLRELKVHS
jgi:hypothetical protein